MITLNEAVEIAHSYNERFDHFAETKKSFILSVNSDFMSDGGLDGPIVIVKEDGSALNFVSALTSGLVGETIREGDL
jgi:SOS-response transcriptional repressor LexA